MIVGLLLKPIIEGSLTKSFTVIGFSLIGGAVLLWLAERRGKFTRSTSDLTFFDAMVIGAAQCLALFPGNSRSGSTMMPKFTVLAIRRCSDDTADRSTSNSTAADMMKLAMVRVHDRMRGEGCASLLMLQVHDELVFECPLDEVDRITAIAREEMQQALPLDGVPIVVETGVGGSWYEAH